MADNLIREDSLLKIEDQREERRAPSRGTISIVSHKPRRNPSRERERTPPVTHGGSITERIIGEFSNGSM